MEIETQCLICNSTLFHPAQTAARGRAPNIMGMDTTYDCPRCGEFSVDFVMHASLKGILDNDTERIALLSHSVRRMKTPLLSKDIVETVLKGKLPNPMEQADNFILWLGDNVKGPGECMDIRAQTHQSIIGAKSDDGFYFILLYLVSKKLIEGKGGEYSVNNLSQTLTFDGWKYYEELKKGVKSSRKAFMAMKFGEEPLKTIVENVFKPAVQKTGFDLRLLTDNQRAGLIDDRLRVEIRTSRFLIADLTHDNAGAYWEAGYAEGLNKPVIYTCEKTKFDKAKTHFDTNHHLTIKWDADNPDATGEELKATIRATLPEDAILTDE